MTKKRSTTSRSKPPWLNQHATLESVTVYAIDFKTRDDVHDLLATGFVSEIEGDQKFRQRYDGVRLHYQCETAVKSTLEKSNDPLFTATVGLKVIYYAVDFPGTEHDANIFGFDTVAKVVHPYIRELLQSLTARAGLPPLILPDSPNTQQSNKRSSIA